MNVSLLVCTHGAREWEDRGRDALDSTLEEPVAERFALHYSDGTLAQVRNAAADAAKNPWLLFLDADDRLEPGYVNAMQAAMHHWNLWRPGDLLANPVLLAPAVRTVDERWRPCTPFAEAQLPNRHQPLYVLNHCVIGTLVPRSLFLQVGGFHEWPAYEDWALALACVRAGARVVDVPDAVYRARVTPDGRNSQPREVLEDAYRRIQSEHLQAAA